MLLSTQQSNLPYVPLTKDELSIYSKSKPSTLIVIDFNASWCKPCKEIKPFILYLQDQYPDIEFYDIDIEDDTRETIISNFNIKKVPTFIYYKNDIQCSSLIGTDKNKLEELINEFL